MHYSMEICQQLTNQPILPLSHVLQLFAKLWHSCAEQSSTTSSNICDSHNTVVGILHSDEAPA